MMTMVMSMAFVSCNEDDELDVLTEIESEVELADDGTMIVVDGGRKHMGETIRVLVTSVLQTPAGRMIFGKPKTN